VKRALPLLSIGAVLLSAFPARADQAAASPTIKKNSVAVMDTVPQNVPAALAALTTQTITSYVANNLGLDVIAKDDIKRLVSFQQLQQITGCDSGSCAQAGDVGKALGVEKIVTSTLGKIGDKYQLSVVAMDVATSKATGRGTRELRSEDEIVENARDLVHFALKNEQRESKGYARISVNSLGATIVLDGQVYGVSPLATPVRLLAGRHTIHVEKDAFIPFDGAIDIEVGKESGVEVKLFPKASVQVAGVGYLPWAGATLGLAVVGGGLSIASYYHALNICRQWQLDSSGCAVAGKSAPPATLSQLTAAQNTTEFFGNQTIIAGKTTYGAAFYGGIASGALGAVSVVLFSAYFITGRTATGGGGDEPGIPTPFHTTLVPSADGLTIHF
jgi:hypothetical protein